MFSLNPLDTRVSRRRGIQQVLRTVLGSRFVFVVAECRVQIQKEITDASNAAAHAQVPQSCPAVDGYFFAPDTRGGLRHNV